MIKSITTRVIVFFLVLVVMMNLIVGVGVINVLPDYYSNDQLEKIQSYTEQITRNYDALTDDEKQNILYSLQTQLGGDLYQVDSHGMSHGFGMGKGHNSARGSFKLNGNFSESMYINNLGIEIFAFGVKTTTGVLVYEVSIHTLTNAVNVMSEFIIYLLIISIILGVVMAMVLARRITKPIKALNKLAKDMQSKEIKSALVVGHHDEIGELNVSLNELYDELQYKIYQLSSELEKERQQESLKKRFLAQATHELKTPIAVIQGYAELIYDGMYKDMDEHDLYMENIYVETKNIQHIMNDILDFAKLERQSFDVNLTPCDIVALVSNLLDRFTDLAAREGIHIEATLPKQAIMVSMDPLRIEQAIKNVVANAIEHTRDKITVTLTDRSNSVDITIHNTGEGIKEEDLPFVFDSFYKTKGKKKGSGLGLAIVKEIITAHQGDYSIKNDPMGVSVNLRLKK